MSMYDGWSMIRDYVDKLSTLGRSGTIYRGQANSEWELVPSGFRDGPGGINNEKRLADWKWRSARFATPMPQDNVEWLIMAQHYGLSTPLLDWTTSPLVSLYFACASEGQAECDGCIWISSLADFHVVDNTILINPFQETRTKPLLINAVGRNIRSTAQDSILTLHTQHDYKSFRRTKLFTVPANAKGSVLNQLEKLGISGDRLLYDVGHLVKVMKAEYASRYIKM